MRKIFKDKRGVTAIEYGLMAGLIAVAIIVAITTFGDSLSDLSSTVQENLKSDATRANEIASKK